MARRLIVVAFMVSAVGGFVWAQQRLPLPQPRPQEPVRHLTLPPNVHSGEDIGVRVVGSVNPDGTVQGALVVKIDGQWVEIVLSPAQVGR